MMAMLKLIESISGGNCLEYEDVGEVGQLVRKYSIKMEIVRFYTIFQH